MTPTEKFFGYFLPICEGIPTVTYVEKSDGDRMDRLSADSVGENVYPGVFVMRPRFRLKDNGAYQTYAEFDVLFYVLDAVEDTNLPENYALVDATFLRTEAIAMEILKVLRHDLDIEFDMNTFSHESVMSVTLDNARGSEVKMKITLPVNEFVC